MSVATEAYLDCRGLACPIPIVRLSRMIRTLAPGQTLRIDASDAAFPADLEAWLLSRPDKLLSLEKNAGTHSAVIQRCPQL